MSDGPGDMARLERAESLPSASDMDTAAARIDAATAALRATVARNDSLMGAARLLLTIAGPFAATVPGGAVGVEVAKVALDLAARPRA